MMKVTVLIFASLLFLALAQADENPVAKPASKPAVKSDVKSDVKSPPKAETKAAAKSTTTPDRKSDGKSSALPKDIKKLIVEDTIVGNGKVATKGKTIKVHYTGWLYDPAKPMGRGRQFDSSNGREPFSFALGGGMVIKGWDDGFENMKVGGKRKLIIPSEMGYGKRGAGSEIPPNASLMFEVELLDVN